MGTSTGIYIGTSIILYFYLSLSLSLGVYMYTGLSIYIGFSR